MRAFVIRRHECHSGRMTSFRIALIVAALVVAVGGVVTESWAVVGAMCLVLVGNLWPVWTGRRTRRTALETTERD